MDGGAARCANVFFNLYRGVIYTSAMYNKRAHPPGGARPAFLLAKKKKGSRARSARRQARVRRGSPRPYPAGHVEAERGGGVAAGTRVLLLFFFLQIE